MSEAACYRKMSCSIPHHEVELASATAPAPLISVIIPCRNEEKYISACLESVLKFEAPKGGFELLVVDGDSEDQTCDIIRKCAHHDSRVRILHNPHQSVPNAMNIGVRAARGKYIARLDAHSNYSRDYLVRCLEVMKQTGADNVGGPWVAAGNTHTQRAVAAAFSSSFVVGNACSHFKDYEGLVDSVFPGFYRRQTLIELGLYDEELVRNQDDELNLRLRLAGGKIYQSPGIHLKYYPRSSLKSLFFQYLQYGYWKVRVIQKHHILASWRHIIPSCFILGVLVGPILKFLNPFLFTLWTITLFIYFFISFIVSARLSLKQGWDLFPLLPIVFSTYHLSYGLGFLKGVLDFVVLGRNGYEKVESRYVQLTR